MAFNKREHLRRNIEALRIAFTLEREKRPATEKERQQLMHYSGFGGLKFVLNPVETPDAINQWVQSEQDLYPMTVELHAVLKGYAGDDKAYHRYVDSMRSSVLTAFYTPPLVIDALAETLQESGIVVHKLLEPSAGIGAFIHSFKVKGEKIQEITAYEKDLLTGKVLQQLYPTDNIHMRGFEEVAETEQGKYDLVASNIPFGDASVFDLSFSRGKDAARVLAARSIHNYFFLKGGDMLRDGGILAFLTSQGVLNSQKNRPIREALMQDHHLVSALRLPNNLFGDYAGTGVGSDLIILQKDTAKEGLTSMEESFCENNMLSDNIASNALFEDRNRIIYTSLYKGTDMYGKPSCVYEHEGGVMGIADDLKTKLRADFVSRLDVGLYNGRKTVEKPLQMPRTSIVAQPIRRRQQEEAISRIEPSFTQERGQLSLFELFGNPVQNTLAPAARANKKVIRSKRVSNDTLPSLFDNVPLDVGEDASLKRGNLAIGEYTASHVLPDPGPFKGEILQLIAL